MEHNPNTVETMVKFLQIEPTTRCNFTCGFCCGRHMDQSDLNLALLEQALDLFPDLQHIELQGEGEPLLHSDFFEMVRLINERGIKVSFITNGSLFTTQRIGQILDSRIHSICVSIESTNLPQFWEIRGGNLTKILQGIKDLISARDKRGQEYPTIGWAVTVLNSTKHELPLIADIYTKLGMDGGIRFQFLSEMESYTQIYNPEMVNQRVNKEDEPWIFSQYIQVIQSLQCNHSSIKNFYDELESVNTTDDSSNSDSSEFFNRVFQSCPWLDQALFINRHGVITGCPKIKYTDEAAFGTLGQDKLSDIFKSRQMMREQVQSGNIPKVCNHCFIAESIASRLSQ